MEKDNQPKRRLTLTGPPPVPTIVEAPVVPMWPPTFKTVPNPTHIKATPNTEPYVSIHMGQYKPTTEEQDIVYDCHHVKKRQGLYFESRFESGNLDKAIKISETEYELMIRPDYQTSGHTQWFYFAIHNVKATTFTFHIVNLYKPTCLYGRGMQPVFYSNYLAKQGIGWHRKGKDIFYSPNPKTEQGSTFTMTFSIDFPVDGDTVYLAHCYPFTYTDLQDLLCKYKTDPLKSNRFRHRVICKTLLGNNIDMLSITNSVNSPEELKSREAMILTARVHPGESNSSWMIKGFLDFILGDSEEAHSLRQRFVIKVIPMLNPDGVIIGNYRCNLAGYDLNRQWAMKEKGIHYAPEVYHVRKMILDTSQQRKIKFHLDFHGHNRKHGVFIYGCPNDNNKKRRYQERIFPFLLSQVESTFFFRRCQFKLQKKKQGTSRIALWKALDIVHSYTIESSFCGTDKEDLQMTVQLLERIGHNVGKSIYKLFEKRSSGFVYKELKKGFKNNDPQLVPDESDESDTTSDDDYYRKDYKEKKKKLVKTIKKKPETPKKSEPTTPIKRSPPQTVPRRANTALEERKPIATTNIIRPMSAASQLRSEPTLTVTTLTLQPFAMPTRVYIRK